MEVEELAVEAHSARFSADDERWLRQVTDLTGELRRVVKTRIVSAPSPDPTKGAIDTVLIAAGSAGALTAAVEVFKAWLGRDDTRSIELDLEPDGRTIKRFKLTGKDVQGSVSTVVQTLLEQLGGPQ